MFDVVMPAHGMAMTEGVLLRWLKQAGEPVVKGEPVAEIETDKTNAEVVSPVSGRMGTPLFDEGATVTVGVPIVQILDGDGDKPVDAEPTDDARREVGASGRSAETVTIPVAARRHGRSSSSKLDKLAALAARQMIPVETQPSELNITRLSAEVLTEWLEAMVLIREFEAACDALALAGKIPGGIHSAAGQEAVAIGTVRALAPSDIITSTHRSHHHSLAKGLDPRSIMAELYGKATGCLGGRAGHMHLADFSKGLFGSNGVVGGGLGIAMGAALAADMRGIEQVAVGFFGDGGANTGRVWEFVNLASIWKLPLIVMCENNLYAVESHTLRTTAAASIAERAAGFGLPTMTIDGQDVVAVYHAVAAARERALAGDGPTFVEALTYRYQGHNTGDVGNYREQEEIETWRRLRDPISRLRQSLERAGIIDEDRYDAIVKHAQQIVADAVEFAEQSDWPDPASALNNVNGLKVEMKGNV